MNLFAQISTGYEQEDAISLLRDQAGLYLGGALWIFDAAKAQALEGIAQKTRILAADVFGDLYCARGVKVVRINLETGEADDIWPDIQAWAASISTDPDVAAGQQFLLDWENENGHLPEGKRLHTKMPIIFGGGYDPANFFPVELEEIVAFRCEIAGQIADVPDGSRILIGTD